tara:strand:+ start:110 stop:1051 length:942 start_codon:yes stop_codon:yes gene_type:complete
VNKKIKKIENSNLPLISGGDDMCVIKYNTELDKIVIDRRTEPIVESEKDQIDVFCKDNGIDNFLIFHNNVAMKNTENYYSFPYLLIVTLGFIKKNPQYGKINLKSKKEKIYNCLNFAEHKHRTIIFDNLKERGLLDKGFVSCIYKGVVLSKKIDPMGKFHIETDGWECFNYHITEKSYFNVVTETQHEYDNPDYNGLHITEKTYKALISQPFIIVGQYGHLEKVRELGFQTYPELFDESYDLIENPKDRIEFILDEIERLCNMDKNKLEEIYNSVIWKVDYNRNIMLNFKDDDYSNLMMKEFTSPFRMLVGLR